MEEEETNDKGIVTSKQPNIYVKIIDFLADNEFMDNKSEIVRTAVDKKIKEVCKLQMETDQVFGELLDGMKIVSYHLRQDQIDVIEILVRLGIYSARSEFIRDAIGDYLINLNVLSKILKERDEELKNKIIKLPIILNGEEKTICVSKDGSYFEPKKP